MGLMVHSLEGIPAGHHRDYYIYLLDYGWDEPLADALRMENTMQNRPRDTIQNRPADTMQIRPPNTIHIRPL